MESSAPPGRSIAVIGASLTGLAFTLSVLQASLCAASQITIYDLRPEREPDAANSSGVVLTPNGLTVLDSLGVLRRIAPRCWLSDYRTYKNDRDETVRKTLIANETLYGYKNHRVWRRILLDTLLDMVQHHGVRIEWEARFDRILRETDSGVVFSVNGVETEADMVIGADGIWSTVRKYIDPTASPQYTGVAGVLSHIRWDEVDWPSADHERACTIQGKAGALVLMPEDRDGTVIMVAMQVHMADRSRDEWAELARDRRWMADFFAARRDEWGATAQSIIDAVGRNVDTLYTWPYMRMAPLARWFSPAAKVMILGDAAHALPPSSGQGVNQMLEDVYTLTRVLESRSPVALDVRLGQWQRLRQRRIDAVWDWATHATNVQRLPQEERERLQRAGHAPDPRATQDFDDMRWLYQPKFSELLDAIARGDAPGS